MTGRRLQDARTRLGWSRKRAASTAGLSDKTYENLERGYLYSTGGRTPYRPSTRSVVQAALALGEDARELAELAGCDPADVETTLRALGARVVDMSSAARDLLLLVQTWKGDDTTRNEVAKLAEEALDRYAGQ